MHGTARIRTLARGLFQSAQKAKTLRETRQGVVILCNLYRAAPQFRQILLTRRIPLEKKTAILMPVLTKVIGELEWQLLILLLEENAGHLLPEVIRRFQQLVEREADIVPVTVYSAEEIADEDMQRILTHIGKQIPQTLEPRRILDPDLIGGIKLRIANQVVDGSVATRLQKLKKQLLGP